LIDVKGGSEVGKTS